MNDARDIDLRAETIDDATVVYPQGDIDLSCAPSLRTELSRIQKQNPPRLIINLESVAYMDSSGVATLVEAMQTARRTGSKLILCGLQDKVRSIFEIARLDMVFWIVKDLDAALAH